MPKGPTNPGSFTHRQLHWLTVRVDVFVDTPMVHGWFNAYQPTAVLTPTSDVKLLKGCRVYQSWVNSLKRQSARAVHTKAKGVRLVLDGRVVAGYGSLSKSEFLDNIKPAPPLADQSLTQKGKTNDDTTT